MNGSAPNRRSPLGLFPGQSAPRLYDRVVEVLRTRHYSRRSEEAYLHWIRRFLLFHKGTHPRELAVSENVAASKQNQALAAVLFLYEHVLEQPPYKPAAERPAGSAPGPPAARTRAARSRFQERAGAGAPAGRAGPKVPDCRLQEGLAMGISCFFPLRRPRDGHPASSPPARIRDSEGGSSGGRSGPQSARPSAQGRLHRERRHFAWQWQGR